MKTGNRHREKSSIPKSSTLSAHLYQPVLGISIKTLFSLLPVLFSSCSKDCVEKTDGQDRLKIELKSATEKITVETLDIFTFNDDHLKYLDSYQRTDCLKENTTEIRSQNGNKIIFVCANNRRDIYEWAYINSYYALENLRLRLHDETKSAPVMTAIRKAVAGQKSPCRIELTPLTSEIHLRSLRCEFSTVDTEVKLYNVKVYLTNVNGTCRVDSDVITNPELIMNHGGLDEDEMKVMADPSILYQEVRTPVGRETVRTEMSFLCYPNSCEHETPGTPYTRLVIEGELEGQTYWWPININRALDAELPGIHRNCCYILDITLKRKGSSGPDTVIGVEEADINIEIQPWNEKDDYSVKF